MKKKIFISSLSLLLATLMLFFCTSCGGLTIKASALSAAYSRKTTDEGEVTEDFKNAVANFSFDLLEGTLANAKEGENLLVSPISALLCLALVTNGAAGETRAQLKELLGMDVETLNKAAYAYARSLTSGDGFKVKLANSVWFKETETLTVSEDYLQTCADWYDAEQFAAPFDDSTVKDINGWVKKNTDGMIDSIVKNLPPSAVMYLINTLVFDAKWQSEYEKKQITDDEFHNYDGTKKNVKMLCSDESKVLRVEDGIGFSKNYKGGKYSFVALLPDENKNIYEFAASLDGTDWLSMWEAKEYYPVNVKIPEFSYDTGFSLKEILQNLGVTDMFDASLANFSALASSENGNIYCSEVAQKCFIDVSRNGTKAAAVTWGAMTEGCAEPSEPLNIFLDRPFVYAIADNATGLPLFLGIVSNL
ncbi:MAG: serine protease [Ruminococcaceae bacterium]|nr:serine protease [Oscillospiraceae bacterium]